MPGRFATMRVDRKMFNNTQEGTMNGNKYNPKESDENLIDGQYNPDIQKPYDQDSLKHGKSDQELELDIDADNEKMEENEDEEANA